MMFDAETLFTKQYVRKERQERLLFELTTKKKRYEGLDRFSHESENLLDPRKIIMNGSELAYLPEFQTYVSNHNEPVRILSTDGALDGRSCLFSEALGLAAVSFEPVILLGEGFAYVKAEPVKGGTPQYLLAKITKTNRG